MRHRRAVAGLLAAGCLTVATGVVTASATAGSLPSSTPPGSDAPPPSSTPDSIAPPESTTPPESEPPETSTPAASEPASSDTPSSSEPPTSEPAASGEGVVAVSGNVAYSNTFFTSGVAEPLVILEDQTGFITRNRDYVFPVESQVLGAITSDFYTSPFSYSVTLPEVPRGTFNDVDNDGVDEAGVVVYAVAYWTNTWGDSYLEERDQGGGGWSTAYASTEVSTDADMYYEVVGGKLVVYAPDDAQDFPTDFGADEKLFTEDDPVAPLPAGWSVVDLDQSPFAIGRAAEESVDLLEPADTALDDFSGLSYTEAFDAMIQKFSTEYAWTELKGIDWKAKAAQFRPLFEAAEAAGDEHAYALAMRDFIWSIPDSHVYFSTALLDDDFANDTAGGIGLSLRETDDGQVVVSYLTEGGPAQAAGIELGAVVTELGGQPVDAAVDAAQAWSGPFSNPSTERLQKLRYATRFALDTPPVAIAYTNPGGTPSAATLDVVEESDSFAASSVYANEPPAQLPVEFELLDTGLGYLKITSFSDNDLLSIQLWERAIRFLNENQIPGVVIDMRVNGGGSGWLADQMAAYFFTERTNTGRTELYDDSTGEFYHDPDGDSFMIPPGPDLQYLGEVVVMVGAGCASACEFFSYDLTIDDRATIVGQYPSDGAGGSVEQFLMPVDFVVAMTVGRGLDADGNVHLEGTGVEPDVDVPVDVDSILAATAGEDVVLDAAEATLIAELGG
jgi:C-terminal processing protease CtpA/Prc